MTSRLEPLAKAPGTRLVDSVPAYHNSGPVRTNTYRTGAVGVQVEISGHFIVSRLLEVATLKHLLAGRPDTTFGARLHPLLIHGAACSALVRLDASAAVTRSAKAVIAALAATGSARRTRATRAMVDSAIASIESLRDVLRERQLLPAFHGLASCASYDYVKEHKPLPWLSCSADDRIAPLAWGLVAIACASPPILLLNRQPSLMWFRTSHSMMLRWLGAAAPVASATTGAAR